MRDYCKFADLNDLDKHNPHTFYPIDSKHLNDDSFYLLNSPSSLKTLDNKPQKLATIHELPSNRSKSTNEIQSINDFNKKFFDDDKIKSQSHVTTTTTTINSASTTITETKNLGKSTDDGDRIVSSNTNLNELNDLKLRNENSRSMIDCPKLEKSFFCTNEEIKSLPGNLINKANGLNDPFNLKTPINFRTKKRNFKKPKELAVDVRNVTYQYGIGRKSTKVLNDITLRVPLGGIYGLLGPSGCGKTSLLKIVVGMNRPDQGLVRVFGLSPNDKNPFVPGPGVGYMPQDISLFHDLTVAETLVFYSKIYRMKSHLVSERIEFLLKLLDLEHKGNRLVRQLSGGQKRRVSLAAALVHSPPLVILDEPTVGVDPLLRQQIWDHLVRLAKETSLTVIITTHYIEEARQANTVGLMRFGRVLVESNPERLMTKYNRNNLEDVFLNLCLLDEKDIVHSSDSEYEDEETDSAKSQIKISLDCVRYSVTPSTQSNEQEQEIHLSKQQTTITRSKTTSTNDNVDIDMDNNDEIPKVVVSDYSLPLSPHMVREKENENFNQGSIYANQLQQTPISNNDENDKSRSPLSPLDLDNDKSTTDFLNVKNGRDRTDTTSSLGSSIIEYESISSRDSNVTPVKLATFKQDFKLSFEPKTTLKNRIKTSVHKIGALFYKNVTLLTRNIPLLLFQFFLPSLEIILFGICIGADPFDIKVAVFNQDTSGNLPQRYLGSMDNYTVHQVHYPTLPLAIDAVRKGNAWGAIAFKENFSISLGERHMMSLNADNVTIDHSSIYIFLDMTNQLIGYKLQRTIYESFQKFSKDLLVELDANPNAVDLPIKIGKPIYGDRDPTFTEFMAPGVVLTIAFLATVALTALAFVMERKDGIMDRILVSGVTPFEFLMSHVVTQLCVIVVQIALLLIFTFLVFDIPSRGPFVWVILLTMAQAICGMEYGLLISSLCESETAATMMALGSFYPNLLLSGTVWPTQAMPTFMRYFSYVLPQTIPIESMRYILSRGWDPINHFEVTIGFIITISWTIFFMITTMLAFKRIH